MKTAQFLISSVTKGYLYNKRGAGEGGIFQQSVMHLQEKKREIF